MTSSQLSHSEACQPRRDMLWSQLNHAHRELNSAMNKLDELTRGFLPSKEKLASARLTISRASLKRRVIWSAIFEELARTSTHSELTGLKQLMAMDVALLKASHEHVAIWTINEILSHWEDYCRASSQIRWRMKAAMHAERRTLLPILSL